MKNNDAIGKAQGFAQAAYNAEIENLSRDFQQKLATARVEMARRGLAMSGPMVKETIRITCEHIKAMVQARLNALLEGYELFGVAIDDQLAASISADVWETKETLVRMAKKPHPSVTSLGLSVPETHYAQMIETGVEISSNWVSTQITRRRFMPKKGDLPASITNYHLQGDQARLNVNSFDQSVNVKISTGQVFDGLREELQSRLPDDPERKEILDRLAALEAAQNSPSFGQRYYEFMAAAADHVTVILPFVPALTELLRKAIK